MALLPADLERALAEGGDVPLAANAPLHLESPAGAAGPTLWLVEQGGAEIFAVPRGEEGPRTHLASVAPGQLLCGLPAGPAEPGEPDAGGLSLLAVGRPGTRLRPVSVAGLRALARDPAAAADLAARLDAWMIALAGGLSRPAGPKLFAELRPAAGIRLAPGGAARTQEGVVWVRHEAGSSRLLGEAELALPRGDRRQLFPVPAGLWLIADGGEGGAGDTETEIATLSTRDLLSEDAEDAEDAGDELWRGLARFHAACLRSVVLHNRRLAGQDRERLGRRLDLDRSRLRGAYAQLASILQPAEQAAVGEAADPLLAACLLVGRSQGIALHAPLDAPAGGKLEDRLAQICGASRVRSRRVILRGEWWRRDNGPMVAFREEGEGERKVKRPVALLPLSSRSYELADPADGSRVRVDAAVADSLSGDAHMFYPPLPERPVTPGDLLRSALAGRRGDVVTILLMGAGGGLLGMLVPLLTGQLFGTVLPAAQSGQLLQITLALLVAAVAGAVFQLTRSLPARPAHRRQGRRAAAIGGLGPPALPPRGLLPPLHRGGPGRTGSAQGINAIREMLTGNVLTLLLGAVFSVFSFGLLFYYSWRLALIATVLVLLLSGVTAGLVYLQIRHQRALLDLQGKIASLLFGLINGIAKLRVAGAEARAYARWADRFAEQRRRTLAAQRAANVQTAFNAVYGVLTSLVIFAVVGFASTDAMPTGEFLAFSAAFGQFLTAVLSLVAALSSVLVMIPVYERLLPILTEVPEVDASKAEPGDLAGEIEFSHVSFRYREDGPLILDDVSFRAAPGEFIALVGPSGAGKSTCLRLLLGFEKPTAGSIYFDGQDVAGLAAQSVRRQLGVVLQTGRPMAGSIFSNITGNSNLGIDDAWAAARMAGLEEDIQAMPMGMHTVVSEGRRDLLRRTEAAHPDRAGDRQPAAHRPLRRGDQRPRQSHPGDGQPQPRTPEGDSRRHRPPPEHDRERRPHLRGGRRPGGGVGELPRAARERRPLRPPRRAADRLIEKARPKEPACARSSSSSASSTTTTWSGCSPPAPGGPSRPAASSSSRGCRPTPCSSSSRGSSPSGSVPAAARKGSSPPSTPARSSVRCPSSTPVPPPPPSRPWTTRPSSPFRSPASPPSSRPTPASPPASTAPSPSTSRPPSASATATSPPAAPETRTKRTTRTSSTPTCSTASTWPGSASTAWSSGCWCPSREPAPVNTAIAQRAFDTYRSGLLNREGPSPKDYHPQFRVLLRQILLDQILAERLPIRKVWQASSRGLQQAKKGAFEEAEASFGAARQVMAEASLSHDGFLLARSILESATAFLAFRQRRFGDAYEGLRNTLDADLALEGDARFGLLEIHRIQTAVNFLRIELRVKGPSAACAIGGEIVAYLESLRDGLSIHHSWRKERLLRVPRSSRRAAVTELGNEMAIVLAVHQDPTAWTELSRALDSPTYRSGGAVLHAPVRQWVCLKEAFEQRDWPRYLELLAVFLPAGRRDVAPIWYASVLDFLAFCRTVGPGPFRQIRAAILRDAKRWPAFPPALRPCLSREEEAAGG